MKRGIKVVEGIYYIHEIKYENIKYKPLTPKKMERLFESWTKSLTIEEKRAIRKYRNKIFIYNNINAQLRKGIIPKQAEIISNSLRRVSFNRNIIVYRCLSKKENKYFENYKIGESIKILDFKGTHVGNKFCYYKKGSFSSAGYILFLIPSNSRIGYINALSIKAYQKENELIIDRGQSFTLINVERLDKNSKLYILKLNTE